MDITDTGIPISTIRFIITMAGDQVAGDLVLAPIGEVLITMVTGIPITGIPITDIATDTMVTLIITDTQGTIQATGMTTEMFHIITIEGQPSIITAEAPAVI